MYGPASDYVFKAAIDNSIPIYQYDSYTMKQNAKDKAIKEAEADKEDMNHEGI